MPEENQQKWTDNLAHAFVGWKSFLVYIYIYAKARIYDYSVCKYILCLHMKYKYIHFFGKYVWLLEISI